MNFTDILGSVMNQGMSNSSHGRIEQSMGGLGDILGSLAGAGGGNRNTGGGGLGDMLVSLVGGGASGSNNTLLTGGIGALAGALLGGGGSSVKGALGGSALALLGGLALKALSGQAGAAGGANQLMAGLRPPENAEEEREVQSIAELIVKAMFNAAKADGSVDSDEIDRILGKLSEDGLTAEEQTFVTEHMRGPMDTEGLIRAVPNEQVAAQIYAASLLAIEVDTDAEREYLQTLAGGLGLNQAVVNHLHASLGVA